MEASVSRREEILNELKNIVLGSLKNVEVDVVDLSKAEQGLVQKAKKEGILWSGYRNESSRHTKH